MFTSIRRHLTLILAVAALLSIGLCYAQGVRKGLDTRITYAFEHDAWSMSVGLSRLLFGLHEGYVGYREVVRITSLVLAPNGVHDASSIPFLQDRASIEEALKQAQAIDPKTLPKYTPSLGGHFVTIPGEDVGFGDFYTLAFLLFGFHATAMYNLYFLVFTCSALLFAVEYRKQAAPLATLLLLCGTYTVFFFSTMFDQSGMPSVNANRFAATLSVIPLMHVLWGLQSKKKWNYASIALLLAQALLFFFAVSIRKTGQTQLLLLFVAMSAIAYRIWWPRAHRFSLATLRSLVTYPPIVSALLFLTVGLGYNFVQTTQLNKIYFSECSMPYHMTWHSIFLGLSLHPDWDIYNNMSAPGASGDNIAWSTFEKHMNARGEKFYCNETGGLHKLRLHEEVMRKSYLKFAIAHPKYMFELQTHYKPMLFANFMWDTIKGVDRVFWAIAFAFSCIAGIYSSLTGRVAPTIVRCVLSFAFMALLVSLLPPFLAYPNQVMSDTLWMLVINLCLWIWALTYRVATVIIPVLSPSYLQHPKTPSFSEHAENGTRKRGISSHAVRQGAAIFGLLALGFFAGRASVTTVKPEHRIHLEKATYGKSCGAEKGNVTEPVSIACNGRDECHYKVDVAVLGDPAPGCSKDFEAIWTCGSSKERNKFTIPAEAGLGRMSLLICPPLKTDEAP